MPPHKTGTLQKFDPNQIEDTRQELPIVSECAKTCDSIANNFAELEKLLNTIEEFIEKQKTAAVEQLDKMSKTLAGTQRCDNLDANFSLLKAIEDLIEREKDTAVYPLDESAKATVTPASAENLTPAYPYWWVQTILQIRSAFIVALLSAVRFHLITIAENVHEVTRSPIGIDDLKGGTFARIRRYLDAFAGFSKPSKKLWEKISTLYVLRNLLAHRNGMIDGSGKKRKIKGFVNREKGISISDGQLQLERRFCEAALKSCRKFLTVLSQELMRMCRQQQSDT